MAKTLTIGLVRFSYLHIWEPQTGDIDTGKYSASFLIPKSDTKTTEQIQKAIKEVFSENTDKLGTKMSAVRSPLRDGNEKDAEEYENCFFLNAKSKDRPGIVDKHCNPIIDKFDIKSGDYGFASISLFPYNQNGNKGIGVALNHIMKVKDGESLGGDRISADKAFADIDTASYEEPNSFDDSKEEMFS